MPRLSARSQKYTNTTGGEMTYDEIGKAMGLSYEMVRKIEKSALQKLKRFENRFSLQDIAETIAMLDRPKTCVFLTE